MAEREHGKMDISAQKETFNAFVRFWAYLFATAFAILIFLAMVNS